jgi:hypothetical protein
MRNVWTKLWRKSKSKNSHRLWDKVEKHSGARGASNHVTICRTGVACWINKATCLHTPTRPGINNYARTHARTGNIYDCYCVSTETIICEGTPLFHYTYIACLLRYYDYLCSLELREIILSYCISSCLYFVFKQSRIQSNETNGDQ